MIRRSPGRDTAWVSRPLHPLLLAVYFVLALAAANGSELIRPADLTQPLLWSVTICGVIWAIAGWLMGGVQPGALVASVAWVSFSFFGAIEAALEQPLWLIGGPFGLLVLLTYGVIVFAIVLRRSGGALLGVTRYLNLVTALLLGYSAIEVAGDASLSQTFDRSLPGVSAGRAHGIGTRDARLPDIYLVILDKYTATRMLRANYNFDNRPFEDSLRARGFIVPQAAQANYVHTSLALAAMLNLQYLDALPARVGVDNDSWEPVYPLVEDNKLVEFLHARGYRYVFLPSAFAATRQSRIAEVQLPLPSQIRPEFEVAWRWTTPIPVVHLFACQVLGCRMNLSSYTPESAELLDWKFARLPELAGGAQPVFVFAHLTLPHEPYVYDETCRHREPYWPLDDEQDSLAVKTAYVAQIKCLNRKLLTLVDQLREHSRTPPVILLQADHGHGRLGRISPGLEQAAPWQIAERRAVFAAYALPGIVSAAVSDSISPVNITRLVLQHYFGASLPQLANLTFWSAWSRPYRFTRLR